MDNTLYEKFSHMRRLLRREYKRRAIDPACDRSEGQGRVLAALKANGPMKTRDLSGLLGIRSQSLNELLTKLESGGYIERKHSPDDKRVIIASLTEKGNCARSVSLALNIFESLTSEEKETLTGLFDKIIADIIQKTGEDITDC